MLTCRHDGWPHEWRPDHDDHPGYCPSSAPAQEPTVPIVDHEPSNRERAIRAAWQAGFTGAVMELWVSRRVGDREEEERWTGTQSTES